MEGPSSISTVIDELEEDLEKKKGRKLRPFGRQQKKKVKVRKIQKEARRRNRHGK